MPAHPGALLVGGGRPPGPPGKEAHGGAEHLTAGVEEELTQGTVGKERQAGHLCRREQRHGPEQALPGVGVHGREHPGPERAPEHAGDGHAGHRVGHGVVGLGGEDHVLVQVLVEEYDAELHEVGREEPARGHEGAAPLDAPRHGLQDRGDEAHREHGQGVGKEKTVHRRPLPAAGSVSSLTHGQPSVCAAEQDLNLGRRAACPGFILG